MTSVRRVRSWRNPLAWRYHTEHPEERSVEIDLDEMPGLVLQLVEQEPDEPLRRMAALDGLLAIVLERQRLALFLMHEFESERDERWCTAPGRRWCGCGRRRRCRWTVWRRRRGWGCLSGACQRAANGDGGVFPCHLTGDLRNAVFLGADALHRLSTRVAERLRVIHRRSVGDDATYHGKTPFRQALIADRLFGAGIVFPAGVRCNSHLLRSNELVVKPVLQGVRASGLRGRRTL